MTDEAPGALTAGENGDEEKRKPRGSWIKGLEEEVQTALEPVIQMEQEWTPEEAVQKVTMYITRTANNFHKKGTAAAKHMVEEFVSSALGSLAQALWEKDWFMEVDMSGAIYTAVLALAQSQKGNLFNRLLAPLLRKNVEEETFRWHEENRIEKVLGEALEAAQVPASYHKKAKMHLHNSYGAAHMLAPYGSTAADSPQMGLVQDFVLGWIQDFTGRASDFLYNTAGDDEEAQKMFLCKLFMHLTGPDVNCFPAELLADLDSVPPPEWAFVTEAVNQVWADMTAAMAEVQPAAKKRKKNNPWGA